jgi:uncharacterized LabA/DUF88 family protein
MRQLLPNPRGYLFIDSRHLIKYYTDSVSRWFGEPPEIDFSAVINSFVAEKAFYYDCIDDLRRVGENDAQYEARLRPQHARLNAIREETRGLHIRLGVLKGADGRRRQKEVDVLIAVDMLTHAAQKNMFHAALIAGDQDLKPAVESLVSLGVYVEVAADANHVSQELTWAASAYRKLTFRDYFGWTKPRLRAKYALPHLDEYGSEPGAPFTTGAASGRRIEIYQVSGSERFGMSIYMDDEHPRIYYHDDVNRLKLYAEILWGKIEWQTP